jgi:iron-sulfur cluster assembly protein
MSIVQKNTQQAITVSKTAATFIQQKINNTPGAVAFRLGVEDAGCNQKKYVPAYATEILATDIEFTHHGVTVLVNQPDLLFVAGTQIDYVQEGINRVLRYNNPNVSSECGCGESFNI